MAQKARITVDEAVAVTLRSNLPAVLAEGNDDYLALRIVEENCSDLGLSVLTLGGKLATLEAWNLIRSAGRTDVVAIVDRDTWLFSGTPDEFACDDIILTNGYSIENDLIEDWDWLRLMTGPERASFHSELDVICEWFESRLRRLFSGDDVSIADHPNRILIEPEVCQQKAYAIRAEYRTRLRGKTLLELVVRQLSHKARAARHSKRSLMETSAANYGANLQRIELTLRERLFNS
ncbi:hypothetical protein [Sphingomonas glaciei]|uniref:DUF4435 domain-containing protein n=1 Tax=Sphingomonas glaciei TaxID=2938948 RepID=A0ABY5MUW9_9SPHN|nr:hypothetical protein [Sphingomonas glaciei]UUR08247.1 hypothetical protein M1K48_00950 [Sphingomonas glaciei]